MIALYSTPCLFVFTFEARPSTIFGAAAAKGTTALEAKQRKEPRRKQSKESPGEKVQHVVSVSSYLHCIWFVHRRPRETLAKVQFPMGCRL